MASAQSDLMARRCAWRARPTRTTGGRAPAAPANPRRSVTSAAQPACAALQPPEIEHAVAAGSAAGASWHRRTIASVVWMTRRLRAEPVRRAHLTRRRRSRRRHDRQRRQLSGRPTGRDFAPTPPEVREAQAKAAAEGQRAERQRASGQPLCQARRRGRPEGASEREEKARDAIGTKSESDDGNGNGRFGKAEPKYPRNPQGLGVQD